MFLTAQHNFAHEATVRAPARPTLYTPLANASMGAVDQTQTRATPQKVTHLLESHSSKAFVTHINRGFVPCDSLSVQCKSGSARHHMRACVLRLGWTMDQISSYTVALFVYVVARTGSEAQLTC